MPYSTYRFFRRLWLDPAPALLSGAALLLALHCSVPALADQINPAGNLISGRNPGMAPTADNERLTNLGDIEFSASYPAHAAPPVPDVSGMGDLWSAPHRENLVLHNAGRITITLTGAAMGVGMFGGLNAEMSNSGSITVSGDSSASSLGMLGAAGSRLSNTGSITVSSPYGVGMQALGNSSISNTGSITILGSSVIGIVTSGDSRLSNRGSLTVAGNDAAWAVSMEHGVANNYGVIRVSAAPGRQAHELVVHGFARFTDWALDLRDFSTTQTRPFFAAPGGTLDFTGSRLILRPGTAEQGFVWGREYNVDDTVSTDAGGAFAGQLASVTSELPELLEARLTYDSFDNQKMSLHTRVNADSNPGQTAAVQSVSNARSQMGHLNSLLAGQLAPLMPGTSAGSAGNSPNSRPEGMPSGDPLDAAPAGAGRWQVFGTPYFSSAANHDLDYASNSVGMLLGATYRFNEQFAAGLHLGYSGSRTWGDLMDMDTSAQSGQLGLHGVFNFTPEWYLRGQFTGFISRYHNNYQSGVSENPIYADSEFNGHGLFAALNAGWAWRINEQNTLTPEIGLSWLWSHQEDFDLNWKDSIGNAASLYDMRFDSQDYAALYGTAMLRWRGDFALGGEKAGSLRPALGLGLRQTLTSGEIASQMRFVGTSFSTSVTEDSTVMLAEAGLEWQYGGFAAGLAYTCEYGAQQEVHSGWLTMKFEF